MKILLIAAIMAMANATVLGQSQKDVKEIEAAIEELRKAMIDGNKEVLERLAAPELSYGHSGGYVEDKAEFVEKIATGKSNFESIELSKQTIKVVDNTAVVRHHLNGTTNDSEKGPGTVSLHVLSVWQKQHGKWKLLARQAVKVTQ